MKKKGKGRDYKRALLKNLVRSLLTHKKIVTTKAKAKKLKKKVLKEHGGVVRTLVLGERRGDAAPQVLLRWEGKDAKNKSNQKQRNKKKLASN